MSAQIYGPAQRELLFRWDPPRHRRFAIAGFLGASVLLHALCFYVFQVVYPPTISLLPPPARVSVIAPTSDEARAFLDWLAAEDPALASQTQRPANARAFLLPKLAHVPSFVSVAPQLKQLPVRTGDHVAPPSAMPPAPVAVEPAGHPPGPVVAPTMLTFSDALRGRLSSHPEFHFRAALREAPQSVRFRVAVDSLGVVRYGLLEQSSGDAGLDEQARAYLALTRFLAEPGSSPASQFTWAAATFDFGSDLEWPPAPAERAP